MEKVSDVNIIYDENEKIQIPNTKLINNKIVRVLIEKTPGKIKTFKTLKCSSKSMNFRKENNVLILKVDNFFKLNWCIYSEHYYDYDVEDLSLLIKELEQAIIYTLNQLQDKSNSSIYLQLLENELEEMKVKLEKCNNHLFYLNQEHEKYK